jgi:sugar phosphate isomerase/epimerase
MTRTIRSVGFNTGGVEGDLDRLAAALDHMLALGCDGAEITAVGLDAVVACRLIPHRVAQLRAIMAARPLAYSMHAPIAVNLMDEAHLPLQKRAFAVSLELAAEIDARVVVFHPGRCAPRALVDREAALLAMEREALGEMAEHARDFGVRIAYENMSPNARIIAGAETSYALDPARLAAQLDALGAPEVVACLDTGHARQGATLWGFDMLAACARLAPYVGHVHFTDATGVPATIHWDREGERHWFGVGDMHCPPGWGGVAFEDLAQVLAVRQDTRVVIELKANFRTHAEAETLAAARGFAARLNAGAPVLATA